MRVIIEKNYDEMSKWAANHIVERINAFNPTEKKPFVLFTCSILYPNVLIGVLDKYGEKAPAGNENNVPAGFFYRSDTENDRSQEIC